MAAADSLLLTTISVHRFVFRPSLSETERLNTSRERFAFPVRSEHIFLGDSPSNFVVSW